MLALENEYIVLHVQSKGAELDRLYHKGYDIDYLWSGDPAFWGKKSPVLFPVIGALKGGTYRYGSEVFTMPKHGFARDMDFEQVGETPGEICFRLSSNAKTLAMYPFVFDFYIRYRLEGETLTVRYEVHNRDDKPMPYAVGGHPAFRVPLHEGLTYEDYYLQFSTPEQSGRFTVSPEGLIETEPVPFFDGPTERLPLHKSLFAHDALVFKDLKSRSIALRCDKSPRGLTMSFPGFYYFGIWAASGADFVCLEPWRGIADSVDASGLIAEKDGICITAPGEVATSEWSVTLF